MTLLSVVTSIKPLGKSNTVNAKSYSYGIEEGPPWLPSVSDIYHSEKTVVILIILFILNQNIKANSFVYVAFTFGASTNNGSLTLGSK